MPQRPLLLALAATCLFTLGCPLKPGKDPQSPTQQPPAGSKSDTLRVELCGNGLDDNGNTLPDENCVCDVGLTQQCFIGAPALAGTGECFFGTQDCTGAGNTWGPCVGSGAPTAAETCDGLDNNCNGEVDEGCPCTKGEARDCYSGPKAQAGVGQCIDGSQICVSDEGAAPLWSECVGSGTPSGEVCGDGVDNDCDGSTDEGVAERLDGKDNDCDSLIDEGFNCQPGETQTFTRFAGFAGSGILSSQEWTLFDVSCSPTSTCAAGRISVETVTQGIFVCASTPPVCPASQSLDYVNGAWTCTNCELIVQYGAIYFSRRICAPRPPVTACAASQVQTFVYETERWECRPTCDNGDYDQVYVDGALVCIPC